MNKKFLHREIQDIGSYITVIVLGVFFLFLIFDVLPQAYRLYQKQQTETHETR